MLQGWAATSSPVRVHGRSNNCTLAALSLPPAMQEIQVPSLGGEDPLEEGMVTHFSILAWAIPWRRGTWWTTVHGVARVRHNWNGLARTHTHTHTHTGGFMLIPTLIPVCHQGNLHLLVSDSAGSQIRAFFWGFSASWTWAQFSEISLPKMKGNRLRWDC